MLDLTTKWDFHKMIVLDRSHELGQGDPLYPFALDEWLGRRVGQGGTPICHIWRQPRTVMLGQRDNKLPHAARAREWLKSRGWLTAVRNSGGLAVPLDAGVLNVSIIVPRSEGDQSGLNGQFEQMKELVTKMSGSLAPLVQKGEIIGAYCPGDYDLSVMGRKFCGIAQRWQTKAHIVQAFIVTEGEGEARAELIRAFYDLACGGAIAASELAPPIEPRLTASLAQLASEQPSNADKQMTVAGIISHLRSSTFAQPEDEMGFLSEPTVQMPSSEEIATILHMLRERYDG